MFKIVSVFSVLWIQSLVAIGQISPIDSLKIEANQETNIERKLQLYIDISNDYYMKQLRYDSAFIYLKKIRTIAKKEGVKEMEAFAINNQAIIYHTLGDKEKAVDYFNEGLLVSKELKKPIRVALLYNNIGMIYKELSEYNKALTYLDSALTIVKKGESKRLLGVVYTSLGEVNYAIDNFTKSTYYIEKGVHILDSIQQPSSEAYLILAKSYKAEKKIDLAIQEAEKALDEAKKKKAPKSAYESSLLLSSIYAENGNSEKEAMYLKKALTYNDSLSQSTDLNDLELKELKEQQKEQEQQLNSLKDKELLYKILYIIGAVILLLLGILLFRQYKSAKLTRDIHEVQKNLIQSELERREKNNQAKNN